MAKSKRHLLDERINMRMQVIKVELLDQLKALHMEKTQLEEKLDVVDTNIQRHIGAIEGMVRAENVVGEIASEAEEDEE